MAYGRELYTLPGSAIDAAVIYDNTQAKMQSEINASVKTQINETFTLGAVATTIATNTDLNTIKTPGNYKGLTANTYTNKPSTSFPNLFTLRVYMSTGASGSLYRHQLIIPHEITSHSIYIRSYIETNGTGTWGAWQQIARMTDVNAKFPVSIANGGTGGTTAAKAKANLGLGTEAQNFKAGNYTGTDQIFGIAAKCVNTNCSSYLNKEIALVVKTNGIFAWNTTESKSVWGLDLPVPVANGGTGATSAANARTNLAVLGTAGGTLTGDIYLKSSTKDASSTSNPTSELAAPHIYFRDKNNYTEAWICQTHTTSSKYGLVMQTRRPFTSNGTTTETKHYLAMYINNEGGREVIVTESLPWRKAFGIGTNGAWPLTIAQGGTGQTGITATTTISNVAVAGSGWKIVSVRAAKWGKVAFVNMTLAATAAVTVPANGNMSNKIIATLTTDYRPRFWSTAYGTHDNAGFTTYYINAYNASSDPGAVYLCGGDARGSEWTIAKDGQIVFQSTFILP